jgi:hypothetical protein
VACVPSHAACARGTTGITGDGRLLQAAPQIDPAHARLQKAVKTYICSGPGVVSKALAVSSSEGRW